MATVPSRDRFQAQPIWEMSVEEIGTMNRCVFYAGLLAVFVVDANLAAELAPPNAGRGAGSLPIWNPSASAPNNPPLTVRVLVLNYNPLVPAEQQRRLSEVFRWRDPEKMAVEYKEALEYASGGYLRFEIVEWRNLNEIYAKQDGYRHTIEEYVQNRRSGKDWGEHGNADYPRLLREQNVVPLVDDGLVDEVWVFSDHYFGLWEASMAGPGAFFINGGVYPQVPSRRPFAFYGFNYERAVAEMMHNTSHRTEATLNRVYGKWNLKEPRNHWELFSANHDQSNGVAGVGTCHWPANAQGDYDYGNVREVASWADAFLMYPKLDLVRKPVSRSTWSQGADHHLDYMKWYFTHVPRAAGVNEDRRQNNWYKYIFDFQSYDAQGQPLAATAELHAQDIPDSRADTHDIAVAYCSAEQIDVASLDDDDLTIAAPDGEALQVRLVGGNDPGGRSYRVAHYRVAAPKGSWDKAPTGEFAVSLRPNAVRTTAGNGFPGGKLGGFRVASAGGASALAADADTTLLAHFDGNVTAQPGGEPILTRGLDYGLGVIGQGVAIGEEDALRFSADGVLDPKQGTIEFWIQPRWNGNERQTHVFFQAGRAFDSCLLMQIDGANNVRFMTWGDDPTTPEIEKKVERGVSFSGAGWKAGEWHHLAATWSEADHLLALYVDGRLAKSNDKPVAIGALSSPQWWLGTGIDGAKPANAVFDELRISKRARSPGEIKSAADAANGVESLAVEIPAESLLSGGCTVARAFGKSKAGLTQEFTRDVAWSSSDRTVAWVEKSGTLRAGRPGTATLTARLGGLAATATLTVTDPGLPTARIQQAADAAPTGATPVDFTVVYNDPDGIRRESLGQGDVRVVGPYGFHQFPARVSTVPTATGFAATYRLTPNNAAWSAADRGVYRIEALAFQISDGQGHHVPAGVLGQIQILPADGVR